MGHPRQWAMRLAKVGIGVCLLLALTPEARAGDDDAWLEGVVVDHVGRPVGGAQVMLTAVDSSRWSGRETPETIKRFLRAPKRARLGAVSDGEGRFRIGRLRRDAGYMLTAELASPPAVGGAYAKAIVGPREAVRVVLRPGRQVLAHVLGADGKPAPGACAVYWSATNTLWGRQSYLGGSLGYDRTTDESGRVALIVPLGGKARVNARVPGVGTRSFVLAEGAKATSIVLPIRTKDGCIAHGRVTDRRGKPVGGARVLVALKARKNSRLIHDMQAITRTDTDGRWRLDGLPPGDVVAISIVAPGYAPCGKKQFEAPIDAAHPWVCDLIAIRGASVEGRVVDEAGAPVAGANVMVTPGRPGMAQIMPFNATTDAEGRYRVDGLPLAPGGVSAYAPGFTQGATPSGVRSSLPFRELKPGETQRVDLALERGLTLRGRVVAADGSPIAGARATIHVHAGRRGRWARGDATTSQSDGGFVISGLPREGRASVSVAAPGHGGVTQAIAWPPPAGAAPVQITLPPAYAVRGRLVDLDGLPLPGLPVFIEGSKAAHPAAGASSTGDDGSFELSIMGGGSHRILVGIRWAPLLTQVMDLTPGQPLGDLVVQRSAKDRLRGRVVDETGQPLIGAVIDVRSKANAAHALTTWTDAEGRFHITHIPRGIYSLYVHGSHTAAAELEPGEEEHRIVLSTGARRIVEGRLLTPDGSPVHAGYLHIVRGGAPSTLGRTAAHVIGGRFRFTLPEGESDRLVFTPMQLSDSLGRPINALIDPIILDTLPEGEVVLQLPAAHEVRGRVVDGAGEGVFGLQVALTARDRPGPGAKITQAPLRAWSDADGYFRFVGVREDSVQLTIQYSNEWILPAKPLPAEPGDDDLLLTVRRWKRIAGIVRDSKGEPLDACVLRLWWPTPGRPSGQAAHATSVNGGRFEFPRVLPDKPFTLRVDPPGQQALGDTPMIKTDVQPGETDLDLTLPAGRTIEGTVKDRDGKPIAGCFVYAKFAKAPEGMTVLWKQERRTRTDEHGRYRLLGFEPGVMSTLRFAMERGADPTYFSDSRKNIPAGAHDVNVRLEQGLRIRGTIEGVDPKLLRGLRLSAIPKVKPPKSRRPPSFGFDGKKKTFEIGPVRKGEYRLAFGRNRHLSVLLPKDVVVQAGAAEVRLVAVEAQTITGRLRDANPERFTIQFWDAAGQMHTGRAKKDGTFSFGRLRNDPGVLYIQARGVTLSYLREGVRPSEGPFDIEPAEGLIIEGRIQGLPSKVHRGRVTAVRGPIRVGGAVAEDGLFTLPPLPAGAWVLEFRASRPRGGTYSLPKTVQAGDPYVFVTWKP